METRIEGLGNNREFLLEVLSDPDFENVRITTNYIDKLSK